MAGSRQQWITKADIPVEVGISDSVGSTIANTILSSTGNQERVRE